MSVWYYSLTTTTDILLIYNILFLLINKKSLCSIEYSCSFCWIFERELKDMLLNFFKVYLLIPDPKETIPTASSHGHTIIGNAKTANSIIMSCKHSSPVSAYCIPNITIEIIISG